MIIQPYVVTVVSGKCFLGWTHTCHARVLGKGGVGHAHDMAVHYVGVARRWVIAP